ncbi:hypothetical protein D3C84_1064200 [compost metagenome]
MFVAANFITALCHVALGFNCHLSIAVGGTINHAFGTAVLTALAIEGRLAFTWQARVDIRFFSSLYSASGYSQQQCDNRFHDLHSFNGVNRIFIPVMPQGAGALFEEHTNQGAF